MKEQQQQKKLYCFSCLPRPQLYTFDLGRLQDSPRIQKLSSQVWCWNCFPGLVTFFGWTGRGGAALGNDYFSSLLVSSFSIIGFACIGFIIKHCISYLFCKKKKFTRWCTVLKVQYLTNQNVSVSFLEQVHLCYIFIILVPNTEANSSSVLHPPNCIVLFFISSCWYNGHHWMSNPVVPTRLLLFPEVFFCTLFCSRLL